MVLEVTMSSVKSTDVICKTHSGWLATQLPWLVDLASYVFRLVCVDMGVYASSCLFPAMWQGFGLAGLYLPEVLCQSHSRINFQSETASCQHNMNWAQKCSLGSNNIFTSLKKTFLQLMYNVHWSKPWSYQKKWNYYYHLPKLSCTRHFCCSLLLLHFILFFTSFSLDWGYLLLPPTTGWLEL